MFYIAAERWSPFYLCFLPLFAQPFKYIDPQFFPEVESLHLQAWSSLQPLLKQQSIRTCPHSPSLNQKRSFQVGYNTDLNQLQESGLLLGREQHLALSAFKVVSVVASVVRDPQVVRHADLVLQEPKLKALEARGWRQVFPVNMTHVSKDKQQPVGL